VKKLTLAEIRNAGNSILADRAMHLASESTLCSFLFQGIKQLKDLPETEKTRMLEDIAAYEQNCYREIGNIKQQLSKRRHQR
jgi:hypothetical protein